MTAVETAAAAAAVVVLGRVPADLAGGVCRTRREGQGPKQGAACLPFARFFSRCASEQVCVRDAAPRFSLSNLRARNSVLAKLEESIFINF